MNLIEITDLQLPELQIYVGISENQLRNLHHPDEGIFIAESPYVISLALKAGCTPLSMLIDRDELTHPLLQECKGIPIYTAQKSVLSALTGFPLTLGMLCAMRRPAPKTVAEVCQNARRIAVLEHIMNPTNVGALFRSAAALGIDGILLSDDCTDPLYRRAARVSMGTVLQLPWAYFPKQPPEQNVLQLQDAGFATVAMALREGSLSLRDPRLKAYPRLAIWMGSEGEGLSPATIDRCDHTVMIPMHHGVDSLNVAAASALAFWELT